MYRTTLWACLLLWGCAPDIGADEAVQPLEGAWRVGATPLAHGCPDVADFVPVMPGRVTFERDGGEWVVHDTLDTAVYTEVGPGTWAAAASSVSLGCRVDAEILWVFDAVGPTSFVARTTATYELLGAGCGFPEGSCAVSWALHGIR